MADTVYANGVAIPKINDVPYYFKSKMTICYGPSGSGKSSIIQSILGGLRDRVPLAIVICPTATLNRDYDGIVPEQCIYEDVTKSLMQNIFQRQSNVLAMYEMVRDVDNLRPLYDLLSDEESKPKLEKLDSIYTRGCDDIRRTYAEDEVESSINDFTAKYNKKKVKIMRAAIIQNITKFSSRDLDPIQRTLLTNFNINPAILLLLDDCMASVKEWAPMEETKKLFFQGRHYHVTTIISCQQFTLIPPQLRSNAHVSVFTTQMAVNTYANSNSSGVSNDDRKLIGKIACSVFAPSQDRARPNYKKMVILGAIVKTDHPIQYMIGTAKRKKFGSSALWTLCGEVKRDSSVPSTNQSFNRMFSLKPSQSLEAIGGRG